MEANPKNQVVERLRQAQNVLITVSNNPSVDQLAATIGLALMLNKLTKHTTAIFSGAIPSTIEFLQPENTLEQNAESLRDFIISLDKAKADKLRYKVEEDVVKIFITPYKTSLSQTDFNFEQGDYNVDLVIALGVDQQEHIDQAVTAHGRILHDATVIGVMAGEGMTDVGSINWMDPTASSLCEMLVSVSESLQSGILDGQIATAFLTGIVACTERFSNDKTSPKVMTMAAQLMAAGANQQLISNALIPTPPPAPIAPIAAEPAPMPADTIQFDHSEPPVSEVPTAPEVPAAPEVPVEEPPAVVEQEIAPPILLPPAPEGDGALNAPNEIKIDEQGTLYHVGDLAELANNAPMPARNAIIEKGPDVTPPAEEPPAYERYMTSPPSMGGVMTANANAEGLEPSIDPLTASSESANSYLSEDHQQDNSTETSGDDTNPDLSATPALDETDGRKMVEQSMADLKSSIEANSQPPSDQAMAMADNETAARQAVIDAVQTKPADSDQDSVEPLVSGAVEPTEEPPTVPPPLPMSPAVEESADQPDLTPPAPTPTPPQNTGGNGGSAPDLPLPATL